MGKARGEAGGRWRAGVLWQVWALGAELVWELLPGLEEGHSQTCSHTALTQTTDKGMPACSHVYTWSCTHPNDRANYTIHTGPVGLIA